MKRAEERYNEAASTSKATLPPKRGRPSKSISAQTETVGRRHRSPGWTRLTRCIFQFKTADSGDLHLVMSDSVIEKLLFIKENTPYEHVKIALATINEPLDCTAQDMFYQWNCLREQDRKSSHIEVKSSTDSGRYIVDIDH